MIHSCCMERDRERGRRGNEAVSRAVCWNLEAKQRSMEDSEALKRIEKRIEQLSKGATGNEAEAAAAKGLTVVKLHKGFLLCDFIVHDGVSDESGKWHEAAMTTLMDIVASWTASSFTSQSQVTVHLSVSFYSKPNLQEVVEVEGTVMAEKGKMTAVRVEVRNKHDRQMVAVGTMWMASSHQMKKLRSSKL